MLQGEHSAILSTFIQLPFVIKIFVLSIFEWPLKTGFTVLILIYSKAPRFLLNMGFSRQQLLKWLLKKSQNIHIKYIFHIYILVSAILGKFWDFPQD